MGRSKFSSHTSVKSKHEDKKRFQGKKRDLPLFPRAASDAVSLSDDVADSEPDGVDKKAFGGDVSADSDAEDDEQNNNDDERMDEGDHPATKRLPRPSHKPVKQVEAMSDDEDEEEEEGEWDEVALDDVSEVEEDAVPRQKVVINNETSLRRIRESIMLNPSLPWTGHLTLTYTEPLNITDPDNDLTRELAFYKQALHGATEAKSLAAKHSLPFTRPPDYFAEMVKSDAHMERIRQRLLDESAGLKKSEEARRQRELKKFGKQVQVEKLKERAKTKKDMEERLSVLKRKRKNGLEEDDEFDVDVEDAVAENPSGSKRAKFDAKGKKRVPRAARDAKYGFGGNKRRVKQNTRESTNDFGSGPERNNGKPGSAGKPKRPGKSRRKGTRS